MREERRIVTALFVDLAGSTALGEGLDPEEVKLIVNEAIGRAIGVVEGYGGTVKDLAGDGMLALFGAPVAHEDDPERAVRAALEITAAIADHGREVERAWGVAGFGARAAVHTGEVVVGAVGAGSRVEYGAVGDAVNTAARLQALAAVGGVLVSAVTRRLVEDLFEWGEGRAYDLKGKEEAVLAVPVSGVRVGREREDATRTPFTGREAELARVSEVAAALGGGRGGLLFIVGEPGIGKSRLAGELARAANAAGALWLEGRCVSYGETLPYWPFRDLLRNWLGVAGQHAEVRVRVALRRRLEEPATGLPELYPYLATLLGLQLEPEAAARLGGLSAEAVQFRTFEAVAELVRKLATQRPLGILIDDLHWADPTSLALAEKLLPLTEEVPLLLAATQRPETDHAGWALKETAEREFRHLFDEVALSSLAGEAELALIEALGGGRLPAAELARIREYGAGNPFFLEELVSNALEREEGGDIPATLEATILARLDRLGPAARRSVTAASILGRSFPTPLLAAVTGLDGELRGSLHELLRRDILREERRWPEAVYRFKHALIQDAAGRTLVAAERRELHRRAALWYEDHYREAPERVFGLLAHHWLESEDREQAIRYLRLAGRRAQDEWALGEAAGHLRQLAALLDQAGRPGEATDALFELAATLCLGMNFAEANSTWQQAFDRHRPPDLTGVESPETLRVGVAQMPFDPDPIQGYFTANMRVGVNVVATAVRLRAAGDRPEPYAAERWVLSDDGLTFRVHLRRDLVWPDGEPLTAAHLAASIAASRARYEASMYEPVEAVVVVDDHTLELRLTRPVPYIHRYLPLPSMSGLRPGQDGAGPYRLESMAPERTILERRRESIHWGGGNCGRVEILPGDAVGPEGFRRGELDIALPSGADPEWVALASQGYALHRSKLAMTRFYYWNAATDLHLRRAVALATDRAALRESAPNPLGVYAEGGFVPPAIPGHTPDVALPFDPDAARRELALSGFRGPLKVWIAKWQRADYQAAALQTWREVLEIEVEAVYRDLLAENMVFAETAHMAHWVWWAGVPDPEYYLTVFLHSRSGQNYGGWNDAEMDRLLDAAMASTDGSRRLELFHRADRRAVAEQAMVLPMEYAAMFALTQPWVEGFDDPFLPRFDEVKVRRDRA